MDTVKFNKGHVLVIAHRGLSGVEAENTNAAFVAAGNRSYYGIEADVRRTGDGQFVVNHDGDLKRVAGVDTVVEETALSSIQDVALFDLDGSTDRIDLRSPTVENYVSICKRYNKQSVLELKSHFTTEETVRLIDIIKSFDYLPYVTFISFVFDNLLKVRNILPDQSVQLLGGRINDKVIEKLATNKMDAGIYYLALTKERVDTLHTAGVKVNCWTVDSKKDAQRLVEWGVDYITTNILE